LVNFFAGTGGTRGLWTTTCARNWNVGDPCAQSWAGVLCDASGTSVTGLTLSRCNLSGVLHGDLGAITTLQTLQLGNNRLTGPIPGAWSALVALQTLDLSYNGLIGSLQPLSALAALHTLNLNNNAFSDTLSFAVGMVQLQYLSVSSNQLFGAIPDQFARLTQLNALQLAHNALSGSLQALLSLPALGSLYDLFPLLSNCVRSVRLAPPHSRTCLRAAMLRIISSRAPFRRSRSCTLLFLHCLNACFLHLHRSRSVGVFTGNSFQCPLPAFRTGAVIAASCSYCTPGCVPRFSTL
jgi:hypothetical protein